MATRKRRTAPGDTSLADYPAPDPLSLDESELDNLDDPRRKLSFFDYLDSLSELERNERLLYIYRLEPAIRNAPGTGSYIEKVSVPIDEDYLVTHHGGGKYLLWLKTTEKPSRTDRKHTFVAAGAPKIPEGTTIIDGRTGQPVAQAQAPADSGQNAAIHQVLQMLGRIIESKDKPDDLNAEILKKTLLDSQEILSAAAKKNASSMSGNPMIDKLIEGMLSNLGQTAKPVDPMETLRTQMQVMKDMRDLMGGGDEPRRTKTESFVDQAKGIAELLKTDTTGELRGILFGGGESAEPPGLGASLFRVAEKIITARPDIIDNAANLLGRFANAPATAPAIQQQQPALGGAPGQTVIQPQQQPQPAPAVQQQPTQEDIVIAGVLGVVVNGFNGGHDGAIVAASLRVAHPNECATLTTYMNMNDELIIGWLKSQPVILPIMSDPRFPQFYEDFKAELLDPTPMNADDAEPEQGSAAGA